MVQPWQNFSSCKKIIGSPQWRVPISADKEGEHEFATKTTNDLEGLEAILESKMHTRFTVEAYDGLGCWEELR